MTKKHILIVEDDPIISMSEHQIMENLGYEVTGIALSGEAAVHMAGTDKPDLILMDIMLFGDMNGREADQKIQESHQIPVVFVTAHGSKEQSKSLKTPPPEGIGYVVKPFSEDELGSEIKRLIG